MKGWSHSRRSGIWWSHHSKEDGSQWDNRVPYLQFGRSHGSLWDFILCLAGADIMSYLISETPCWALSPMRWIEPWLENGAGQVGWRCETCALSTLTAYLFLKHIFFCIGILPTQKILCCLWLLLCSEMRTFPTFPYDGSNQFLEWALPELGLTPYSWFTPPLALFWAVLPLRQRSVRKYLL